MTEQDLDDPDVSAPLQKMGGKTVPKRMGRHVLADPSLPPCSATRALKSAAADMLTRLLAGKQPAMRPCPLPVGTQDVQQPRRQHRIPIPAALAPLNVEQHPFAVDRADLQPDDLSDAHASRIGRRQRNAIPQTRNRIQKTGNLLTVEDRRKLLRLFAGDDALKRLLLAERDAVKEPQRTSHLVDVRPRVLLVDQMQLVSTDVLHAKSIR